MASRVRQFAMMPCDMDTWAGWTELEPLEQWAYQLLRRQDDLTAAGTLRLSLNRWARESSSMTADILRDLIVSLAAKDYVIVDFDYDEVLLCWFITTDHVYRKPNPTRAAASAIAQVKSPGIKSALYTEMVTLQKTGVIPVPQEAAIEWLIRHLEQFALIDTRQPLHNPSAGIPQLVSVGSASRAVAISTPSAAFAESSQTSPETGQDNRCTGVPSITSLPVVENGEDVKPENKNLSSEPDGPDAEPEPDDEPGEGTPAASAKDDREDTRALAERLLWWLRQNGETRPGLKVSATWLRDARLLLDTDGRELDKALALLDWCQQDSFWRSRVESVGKFRKQYNKLRQQATDEWNAEHQPPGRKGSEPPVPQHPPAHLIAVPPADIGDDPEAYLEWQRSVQAGAAATTPHNQGGVTR